VDVPDVGGMIGQGHRVPSALWVVHWHECGDHTVGVSQHADQKRHPAGGLSIDRGFVERGARGELRH